MKKRDIKALLRKKFWRLTLLRKLAFNRRSYLYLTGWVESLKRGCPCDAEGVEVPWMNYPVVNFLKERLHKHLHLFEYGSGYSTAFYAQLVRDVISLEYNQAWLQRVADSAPANVKLLFKEKDVNGAYCRAIHDTGQVFDVVVVDGRDRVNCIKQSAECLSETGVIILDDSLRTRYSEAFEYLRLKGFRHLNIEGLKPAGYSPDRTTIFYRDNNCLGL
ncbi:hypothetical protein GCM10011297_25040 [Bacterioplanes sanyensis]|uniref:FkbM family methyltransferase n=1 Tax=Bacterioplanes sanyensis TaxID=1249553 RepID=UPI00167484F8|nr:FkbM family methyltransferase [Bacterioplanes sanyensis]GGY51110.1 hypothetical protein GCM10011297_25040 [Bacterioplanes sanyensis]